METVNRYKDKEWETACEPFQMAPGVYYVGTTFVGAYLLDTGDGLILIDQCFAESVYLIFESIRKLGFDPGDIKLLLLSHAHLDHCGGTRLIQEYTGAKVYMSKEDTDMMRYHPEWVALGYVNWIDFGVDAYYSDSDPIVLGNMKIQTMYTPGHTPGTTSFFFEVTDAAGRRYRCGLQGGLGLNTLIPEFYAQYPGWPKELIMQFIGSLDKLVQEHVDIPLPSHPNHLPILDKAGMYREESNPFINPDGWRRMLMERSRQASALLETPQ